MQIDWHILIVFLVFIVLDVITGIIKAVMNKELNSTIMRNGLFHKSAFLVAIAFAYSCEYGMTYLDLGFSLPIVGSVCIYICLTETVSILENLGSINPELANSKFMNLFATSKSGDKDERN
jgi:toxin secretion/phage lysis holin